MAELNVVRDNFNKDERRKLRWTCYTIWFNVAYHVVKVVIPTSTLIACSRFGTTTDSCETVTNYRIRIMLICDCIYASLLFFYEIFCVIKLICFSWKYSRHEARTHMSYFVLNSLGLLLALPIVINDLVFFTFHTKDYDQWRLGYYLDWFAKTAPSLVYLLTKKTEDCFLCFNRLAPQTYSVIQYTKCELAHQDQTDRLSLVGLSLTNSHKRKSNPLFFNVNATAPSYSHLSSKCQLVAYPCSHGRSSRCDDCEQRLENELLD